MLAVILLALANNSSIAPVNKKFPAVLAVVVVCTTTALEDDLVRDISDIWGKCCKI